MQIETYEVEEINASEASTMAADAESIELIEKLGLTGQKFLTDGETLTRQPYGLMTKEQSYVFQFHCPVSTKLEDYSASPIPLRILQVAALCREQKFFKCLYVWHPKVVKTDPILVGYTTVDYWSGEPHLLARWGSVLEPYPKLMAAARTAFEHSLRLAAQKVRDHADALLKNATLEAQVRFSKSEFGIPSTYNL